MGWIMRFFRFAGRWSEPFRLIAVGLTVLAAAGLTTAKAADLRAAVAANFTAPAKELAAKFQAETGDAVKLSFGSTGQLYAQITQGAPFDVFLSADSQRAAKAEEEGWAVKGSRFTYAIGTLVLWSADPKLVDSHGAVLKQNRFGHLALANPVTAPYGAAAVETMKALGVYDAIAPKIVTGENVSQTYQFVASGNAELGFVALSQVIGKPKGSRWLVPSRLYSPIRQDAVLLKQGEDNQAAKAFVAFLKSPVALAVIRRYGYAVPPGK